MNPSDCDYLSVELELGTRCGGTGTQIAGSEDIAGHGGEIHWGGPALRYRRVQVLLGKSLCP